MFFVSAFEMGYKYFTIILTILVLRQDIARGQQVINSYLLLLRAPTVIALLDLKLQYNPTLNIPTLFRYELCLSFWYMLSGKGPHSNSAIKLNINYKVQSDFSGSWTSRTIISTF